MASPFAFLRATWLIFGMHIRTTFGSKRILAAMVLAAIPPLLGGLGSQLMPTRLDGAAVFTAIGVFLLVGFVVPMLSVSLGVGAIADEAEGRTITYPFTRPIPRASLFVGRWLAALLVIVTCVTISTFALAFFANLRAPGPSGQLIFVVFRASLVGSLIYSIGAAVIGTQFKRGLVIAFAYTFAFELLVANAPGSAKELTIQHHLRAMVMDEALPALDSRLFQPETDIISAHAAMVKLTVIAAVLFVIGCWRVTRKQFVLSA